MLPPLPPFLHPSMLILLPHLTHLQATIPLVEVNNYRRRWFLRSLAFSPLFVAAYLHLFTWQASSCFDLLGARLRGVNRSRSLP